MLHHQLLAYGMHASSSNVTELSALETSLSLVKDEN